jgi:co-chaperonin GroES (HSP10)
VSEVKKIFTFDSTGCMPTPEELEWAFPDLNPGMAPLGWRVIVQLRRIKRTAGSIILVSESRDTEKWQNMIGKVVAIGPLAFVNRDTLEPWKEGAWTQIGDYVRVPKWGGDRWEIKDPKNEKDPVLFMTLNDRELIAKVTSNPLSFSEYV